MGCRGPGLSFPGSPVYSLTPADAGIVRWFWHPNEREQSHDASMNQEGTKSLEPERGTAGRTPSGPLGEHTYEEASGDAHGEASRAPPVPGQLAGAPGSTPAPCPLWKRDAGRSEWRRAGT